MRIVIEIPDDFYERVNKDGCMSYTDAEVVVNAFYLGKVLPKGHGALKDVVKVEEAFWNNNLIDKNMDSVDNGESQKMRRAMIRTMYLDVPTIVEADKEGAEK